MSSDLALPLERTDGWNRETVNQGIDEDDDELDANQLSLLGSTKR